MPPTCGIMTSCEARSRLSFLWLGQPPHKLLGAKPAFRLRPDGEQHNSDFAGRCGTSLFDREKCAAPPFQRGDFKHLAPQKQTCASRLWPPPIRQAPSQTDRALPHREHQLICPNSLLLQRLQSLGATLRHGDCVKQTCDVSRGGQVWVN